MRKILPVAVGIIAVALCAFVIVAFIGGGSRSHRIAGLYLVTNEEVINGLYSDLDFADSMAVFRTVYHQLPDCVTVYPSENYYYFKMTGRGRTVNGSMTLYVEDRHEGRFGFGYVAKVESPSRQQYVPVEGSGIILDTKDGLHMNMVTPNCYSVDYEGKRVYFNLYHEPFARPTKSIIRSDETYVGPSFDESGLRFHLVFNNDKQCLYWVLNEEGYVPERFTYYSPSVLIGDRTGFAFYNDSLNKRKILIGVDGFNVLQNNWYDGPFDQMPDNYVDAGTVSVQRYLEAAYHLEKNIIDKFGKYPLSKGARLPVAPYCVYFKRDDLAFADSLLALRLPDADLYAALTRQRFDTPKELRY